MDKIENKQCSTCKEVKSIDNYNVKTDSKTGYSARCKMCDKKARKTITKRTPVTKEGVKVCNKCKEEKPLSAYPRNNARPDGLHPECKACEKARRMAQKTNEINYAAFYLPVNYY